MHGTSYSSKLTEQYTKKWNKNTQQPFWNLNLQSTLRSYEAYECEQRPQGWQFISSVSFGIEPLC